MAEPIRFWFDFSSPYSYLASQRIEAICARYGRRTQWRPILLGAVFAACDSRPQAEQAHKWAYARRDIERSARFLDVPYRHPTLFPVPTVAAARAFYLLHSGNCERGRQFAHAVFRAYFVDGHDISRTGTVLDIAAGMGVDRDQLANDLTEPDVKARLRAETDAAIAAGVIGAPWIDIDGEPFWGADRLPQIEHWLARKGF